MYVIGITGLRKKRQLLVRGRFAGFAADGSGCITATFLIWQGCAAA